MASNLLRVTDQLRGYRPFIGAVSADVAEFSAGDVLAVLDTHKSSGTEHNWLYYTKTEIGQFLSYKADKARVWTAGLGLTGGGSLEFDRSFAIDTTAELSWTNTQHFQTILPGLTDTYDLGNMDLLWRKIWGSELSAVVLKEYEQFVMGGLWQITKQEGAIEAGITAADTQVDFGQAMTVGDFVVFRSAGKVEYMSVGTPVINTTYSVTRDLDGSGANDWPAGSVYAVLGKSGDGRIVFDAINNPRMSIFSQGATYNAQAEQLRFGDLNGNWGYPTQTWGVAIGEYASGKANLTLDPVNGLRLRNYQTDIIKLTGSLATFENWIQLGTNGGIRQGSGSWGVDFTGTAIWNASGYGRIAGLKSGVMQWWSDNQGWLNAGAGNVFLNNNGLSLVSWLNSESEVDAVKLKWVDSETKATTLIALFNQYTTNLGNYISTLWIHSKTAIGATGFINLVADQTSVYGDLRTVGGDISSSSSIGAATSVSAGTNISANGTITEAGQRVFSPNNPQVVAFATPAILISGNLTVNQTVDINVTSHGVPSGSRFVLLQVDVAWGAANGLITVSRGQTAENDIIVRAPAANVQTAQGIVKCRVANNLIRFVNKNAATTTAYIRMFGYEM